MRTFISPIAISRCFSNGKMRALRWGMPAIQSFRDLLVWRKAMDLACRTYSAAQKLPRNEQAVLGYQLRKTAVSIPSNIAEGTSRRLAG